jgi:hypothetical protein
MKLMKYPPTKSRIETAGTGVVCQICQLYLYEMCIQKMIWLHGKVAKKEDPAAQAGSLRGGILSGTSPA